MRQFHLSHDPEPEERAQHGALDDQHMRLYWPPKKLPVDARYWVDIAKEPKLKMLLSRIRSAVRQDSAARMWSRIMREHDRLRRNQVERELSKREL
jgi:hypothetical protein